MAPGSRSIDSSPTRASTTTNNNEMEVMVGRMNKFHLSGPMDGLKQKTKKDRKRIAKLEAEMRQSKEELRQLREQVQASQEIARESKHSVSAGTTSGRGRVLKITPLDGSVPRATDSRTPQRNHPERDAGHQWQQQQDDIDVSSGSRTSDTIMAPPDSPTKRRGEFAEVDHRGSGKRQNSIAHVASIPPPWSLGPPVPMSPVNAPRNIERRAPSPVPMDLDDEDDDDLPLHFERDLPPACARKGTLGAFELDELKYLLDMHENEVSDIESLKTMEIPSFAVHISNDVAFVYEALTFETARGSYLVNWGLEEAKMDFDKVFAGNGQQVFHTFIHPTSRTGWWYLGALTWRATRLPDIWKRLDREAKEDIQENISQRMFKKAMPEAIGLAIDQRRLKQMCVEVKSGEALMRRSQEFARQKRLDD